MAALTKRPLKFVKPWGQRNQVGLLDRCEGFEGRMKLERQLSNCKLIIAARVCRVRHFPVGIAGCVVLLLYGLGALAAVPDSKDGELDFSGSRRSLLRAEPQLRNARSGYGLAAIHTDGKGSLTSVNATEGGFSVPNSQPGTQKIGLRLQPDAWAAGLRVRLLSQTLPGDSRSCGRFCGYWFGSIG